MGVERQLFHWVGVRAPIQSRIMYSVANSTAVALFPAFERGKESAATENCSVALPKEMSPPCGCSTMSRRLVR